jgi:serine/threonine-protein kinase
MPPAPDAQPEPQPAFRVERYAVFDEFAAGGMATVHFARLVGAHGFRRTVAVKRLLPHLTRNQDFALMLIDEARLAARVSHPNVVTTLDVVLADGELLLVMEYVHGESLAKLSDWARERGERIPVPIACAVMADALHGLHAAHEASDERGAPLGLVHRDVSPQNVLVGLDGITRIADFGVAKAAGRAQSTADGILKGKLAYMAPEQLSSGEVSRVSDVFAAAVVLWEALTGKRLFAGKNHAETAFKVLSAPIPTPTSHGVSLPSSLEAAVMRGLARPPEQRFASAREMALALEHSVPSVRPSELARWVEQTVGDRLAARTALLRAIERSAEVETQGRTEARPRSQRAGSDPTPARDQIEPLATPQAHGKATVVAPFQRRRAARTLAMTVLVALLALGAFFALRRPEPTSPASAAPSAPSTAQPSASEAQLPGQRASSTAPPTTQGPEAGVESAAALAKPRARRPAKPPTKRAGCDPPFTIDAAGHVLFKPACM